MNIKNVSRIGLVICLIYFLVVVLLIVLGNNITILLMDIITIISGIYMVILVMAFPIENNYGNYRILAIIFALSCMILTNMVHWINIIAINPMIAKGINVPDYFQIGKWPSVLMTVEYLGWGLFMGMAFLFSGYFIEKTLKFNWFLYLCGCLCLIGFFGIIINENLWYIAPLGYGLGTSIICIKFLIKRPDYTSNNKNKCFGS